MKISVIGNSHSVAIRKGWEALVATGEAPDHEVEFFALEAAHLNDFRLGEDGCFGPVRAKANYEALAMQAMRLNERESIDLSHSDVVILVGLNLQFNALLRTLAHINVAGVFDLRDDCTLLSRETLEGLAEGLLRRIALLGDWSAMAGRPLLVVRPPWLSQRFLKTGIGGRAGGRLGRITQSFPEVSDYVAGYSQRAEKLVEDQSPFTVIGQPEVTVTGNGIFTRAAFSAGAVRLNGDTQPAHDVNHANEEYGRLYWQAILDRLPAS